MHDSSLDEYIQNVRDRYTDLKKAQLDYWNNTYYNEDGEFCVFGGQVHLDEKVKDAQSIFDSALKALTSAKEMNFNMITKMKIKRFRLKSDVTLQKLKDSGLPSVHCTFIHPDAVLRDSKFNTFGSIDFDIGFPEDLSKWNDKDFVLVVDDDLGQPYTPFYNYLEGKARLFEYLQKVIIEYNKFMESRWYLEEIKLDDNKEQGT